jgi:flagellar hook-associated protein 1 FlgK
LLDVRDRIINRLTGDMDKVAYTMATEVNRAHLQGFDQYSKQAGLFFEMPEGVEGASSKLKVDENIARDVGRIAAAAQPGSPGDNRIANVLSSLQYKKVLSDGSSTMDDFYGSVVGQIGIETQRANSDLSSQKDILGQLKNIRESISGVSLDEETTKMIEFQKTFDASARLIRTADEMMDTVLNLKRI